jgi:hypothetical protein
VSCASGIVLILRATFWACSIGGGALSGIDGIVVALQRSFQAAAWLFAGAILVLSLSPPSLRPTTGAANGLEHFMIFLGTGMAFAFGYPRQLRSLLIASPVFAAAIDVVQNWGTRPPREDGRFRCRRRGGLLGNWIIACTYAVKVGTGPGGEPVYGPCWE